MVNKNVVYEALKQVSTPDINVNPVLRKASEIQDTTISLLIHDIFGAEILKTHIKKSWHFYNRIDGERIDFAIPAMKRPEKVTRFEDIPASPDETISYVDQTDYTTFFMNFIRAFEETIGLDRFKFGFSM
jgi:hypothetical protein